MICFFSGRRKSCRSAEPQSTDTEALLRNPTYEFRLFGEEATSTVGTVHLRHPFSAQLKHLCTLPALGTFTHKIVQLP